MNENKKSIALEAYEKLATAYSEIAPTKPENGYIERPGMMSAIEKYFPEGLKEKLFLDAGCGPGILAERLLNEDAKIVGFDISPKMIEEAIKRNHYYTSKSRATFFVANMEEPLLLEDGLFDAVVSSLAIDYIYDWTILMNEFFRVLKPNGKLIFTIQHPLGSWNWYKPESAFGKSLVSSQWKDFTDIPVIVPDYYRSFSEVLNPVVNAQFKILCVEDLKPIESLKHVDNYKYQKYNKLASFMLIAATKS